MFVNEEIDNKNINKKIMSRLSASSAFVTSLFIINVMSGRELDPFMGVARPRARFNNCLTVTQHAIHLQGTKNPEVGTLDIFS